MKTLKCHKCGRHCVVNDNVIDVYSCGACTFEDPPAVHFDGDERFGTPAEMIAEIKRLRAMLASVCPHSKTHAIPHTAEHDDIEVCDVCGKSRSRWEQGESDWVMVDLTQAPFNQKEKLE